ncbi:MAG: sigma 54-interacting transcriptional regulator [Byssovorax sp.]
MAHPRDAATAEAPLASLHHVRLTGADIEVVSGPDAGATIAAQGAPIVVGTGSACDLRLTDDLVSRRHVELFSEPSGVRVVDLGSRNGTFFGEARVREMQLARSAVISLGGTSLSIRLRGEPLDVALCPRSRFGDAVGHSTAMRQVFALLERAATNQVTVLLEGDSGSGKDILATSLHQESARREGPFVVVDCGAIPRELIESELFGHEKGAFTGANAARVGAFEQADGGTLFLDEIGELPLDLQPKLLRVLESRSFRRVGSSRVMSVDVRVVAATNRRLREAVRLREFREDLFYRLAVVHVRVPSLAERREDVGPLAERFLRRATGDAAAAVPPDLLRLLVAYDWPGNVRELRNVVERFATFERADPALLFQGGAAQPGSSVARPAPADLPYHEAKRRVLESFNRAILGDALARAGGSIPRAAELLGLPRQSVYRMLKETRGEDADEG